MFARSNNYFLSCIVLSMALTLSKLPIRLSFRSCSSRGCRLAFLINFLAPPALSLFPSFCSASLCMLNVNRFSEGELFGKIQRLANSKLENHQHVHALLTAVTSVIREKGIALQYWRIFSPNRRAGGPGNPTAYFAVLQSLLADVRRAERAQRMDGLVVWTAEGNWGPGVGEIEGGGGGHRSAALDRIANVRPSLFRVTATLLA